MPEAGPRLRMAPAPSGFLHLGNVRTFLFDFLYTRAHNGKLVLRIEDTDANRSSPEAEAYIVDSLHWLGIEWDEGPDIGGPHGPYRQSEREASHRAAVQILVDSGHAYECFCTPEELEDERKEQQSRGQAPRYSGRCYRLTEEEKQKSRDEGRIPAIRFHVPEGKQIAWDDLVYGRVAFQSDDIGDFIILRPNGSPIYNMANVSDDHEMEITVGLRSQSHLSNTPRQILLYEGLGWEIPAFAHVPDVLDLQGRKMGKRYGAKGVTDYRAEGYLPEALVNYMALLGWSSPTDEEFLSMDELCAQFSFDRVQKSNAAFDPVRLEWFNAEYIRRSGIERLVNAALPFLQNDGLVSDPPMARECDLLSRIVPLVQTRVRTLADIPPMIAFFFSSDLNLDADKLVVKGRDPVQVREALGGARKALASLQEWRSESILAELDHVAAERSWKRGELLMAVRIAITGRSVTPPLTESMEILGRDEVVTRLRRAMEETG